MSLLLQDDRHVLPDNMLTWYMRSNRAGDTHRQDEELWPTVNLVKLVTQFLEICTTRKPLQVDKEVPNMGYLSWFQFQPSSSSTLSHYAFHGEPAFIKEIATGTKDITSINKKYNCTGVGGVVVKDTVVLFSWFVS